MRMVIHVVLSCRFRHHRTSGGVNVCACCSCLEVTLEVDARDQVLLDVQVCCVVALSFYRRTTLDMGWWDLAPGVLAFKAGWESPFAPEQVNTCVGSVPYPSFVCVFSQASGSPHFWWLSTLYWHSCGEVCTSELLVQTSFSLRMIHTLMFNRQSGAALLVWWTLLPPTWYQKCPQTSLSVDLKVVYAKLVFMKILKCLGGMSVRSYTILKIFWFCEKKIDTVGVDVKFNRV